MKKLLLFATFVYFVFASFTYHSDNKAVLKWASANNGTVWNIWSIDTKEVLGIYAFNYPPFHFYLDKLQYFISKPLAGPGYYEWLSGQTTDIQAVDSFARYSFALKFPLILIAFLAAFVVYKLAKQYDFDEKKSVFAAGIWIFNPITLYSVAIMGQNDVMAVTIFLIGWLFLAKKKLFHSAIAFGLAASTKLFPLLWVPFLLLYENKISIKKRVLVFVGSILTFVATLLPFINNPVFRDAVFSLGIDRFFVARIDLGFDKFILLVPTLLLIMLIGIQNRLKNFKNSNTLFLQAETLLVFNVIFLFFNHYHPQWFIWLIPFFIFTIFFKGKQILHFLIISFFVILAWLGNILLFNDQALSIGILRPLNIYLGSIPSPAFLLEKFGMHVSLYNNYIHSFLAGIGILTLCYFSKDSVDNSQLKIGSSKFKKYFKKKIIIPIALFTSILILFISSLFAHLLPTPILVEGEKIIDYPFITEPIQKDFVAQHNNLNRIDFILSDNELNNFEDYVLTIIDKSTDSVILNQPFNGLNIGFRSTLRTDFPPQRNSLGKEYRVTISPVNESAHPLRIASNSELDPNQMSFTTYYQRPSGQAYIYYVLKLSGDSLVSLLRQNFLVYLAAIITLWFAL